METTYIDSIKDIIKFIENTDLSNSYMEIIQVNLAYVYPEYKNESYNELYQYVRNFLSNDDSVEDTRVIYTNNEYLMKTLNILMKRHKCILLTDIIMDDKRIRIHYDKMGD
jgi:hypothetical protein